MQTRYIDTQEAEKRHKYFAFQDAQRRSNNNRSHYSVAKQVAAERMRLALDLVYASKEIYVAFGKKFITVKVDQARVRNKQDLSSLEQSWTQQGYTKVVSAQGVIYHIPKQ